MEKYHKCNFCMNKLSPRFCKDSRYYSICIPKSAADKIDFDAFEFVCENGFDKFILDGDKVVETAKELGISITDLLALINVASK